jgi:hypothetical protein
MLCLLVLLQGALAAADEPSLSEQHPDDQGMSKDPSVLFATDFEEGIQEPLKITRKGVVALQDDPVAFSGKGCVRITATKNVDEGGDVAFQWKNGVDQCYLRVYVRFDKETLMPHHFLNLTGFTDTYKYRWGGSAGLRPPGGKDGKVGTTLEPPKGEHGKWKLYTYWHEMHSWQTPEGKADGRPNAYYGNNFQMEEGPDLVRDRWICCEMMIKLNTPGQYDGEQAFWIDGKRIGHWKQGSPEGTWMRETFHTFGPWNAHPKPFEGFNWRTDAVLKINKILLQWYLSSDQSWPKMTAERNIVYFDNLVVATKYIGPLVKRRD